jgi:tetratricopeptide (TPR) repeat protein
MISLRLARELTYQLDKAGEHERLALALAKIPVFLVLYKGEDESDVLMLWQQLSITGYNPEHYYRDSLEILRNTSSRLLPSALRATQGLFKERGEYSLSVELLEELAIWADKWNDLRRSMEAHRSLGFIRLEQGDFDQAMTLLTKSLHLADSLGDAKGIASAYSGMSNVHFRLGHFDESMLSSQRQLEIATSVGAMKGISTAIGNIGVIHGVWGQYDDAIACYDRQMQIEESLGDKRSMSIAIGNMGIAHHNQGHYTAAMSCYERWIAMAKSLGNKSGVMLAISAIGYVYLELGQYERALSKFRDALEMALGIGAKPVVAHAIGCIALTLLEMVRAMPSEYARPALLEARANAEECVRISGEISRPDTLFSARVLLSRIDAAEGNTALAAEKLEAMLAEATEEEQIADLHYWLWKIGGGDRVPGTGTRDSDAGDSLPGSRSPDPVLTMYEKLYARIPKFEFRKRIAELRGERVPMSADDLEEEVA